MSKLSKLLAVSLFSTAAITAHATDGKITITGKVVDGTCTLAGAEGATGFADNIAVALKTVQSTDFSENKAGTKEFTLKLTDGTGQNSCGLVTNKAFKGIHITTASSDDHLSDNPTALINKATNAINDNPVYIQLLTDKDKLIDFTTGWGDQAKSTIIDPDDQPKLKYKAQYFKTAGDVAAQDVSAVVNYTLQYN